MQNLASRDGNFGFCSRVMECHWRDLKRIRFSFKKKKKSLFWLLLLLGCLLEQGQEWPQSEPLEVVGLVSVSSEACGPFQAYIFLSCCRLCLVKLGLESSCFELCSTARSIPKHQIQFKRASFTLQPIRSH